MCVYALSGLGYLAFIIYGYRIGGDHGFFIGWALIAALRRIVLVLWITAVNVTICSCRLRRGG